MSRIYFHSPSRDVEVRGSERAYMGGLCGGIAVALMGWDSYSGMSTPHPVLRFIPATSYLHSMVGSRNFAQSASTWMSVAHDSFWIDGREIDIFGVNLNTALVAGSDAVKLCARLHGQCEIHCYVEGANRAWLAGIIERGREVSVLRSDMGWEDVISLLRERADEPVVMSYSVCEQFPNPGRVGEEEYEAWYELDDATRWERAMARLRADSGGLEIKPDTWDSFYFSHGITAFQIIERALAERPK